jgi:hypothetical protein
MTRKTPLVVVLALAWMGAALPARAVTLVDNDKVKIDMEARFMFWGAYTGPDLVPGTNSAPPPAQDENIEDFFVRRARLLLRARLSDSLDLVFQMGQDNIGSKVLRDDAGFRFKDAALNWRKTDAFQVIVGQFKVPFLRQNLASGFNQLLVDRSLVTTLRPGVESSRDEGGMAWGNAGGLQYRAGVCAAPRASRTTGSPRSPASATPARPSARRKFSRSRDRRTGRTAAPIRATTPASRRKRAPIARGRRRFTTTSRSRSAGL